MSDVQAKLPPGPKGRWLSTLSFMRDARGALGKWAARYGDPFFVNVLNGPIVITGRPDLIGTIFGSDPKNFEAFAKDGLGPLLGNGSMLLLEGEPHKRERKLIMPMFHGKRMKSYAQSIEQLAAATFESNVDAGEVAMHDITTKISLDVVIRVLIGADPGSATAGLVDDAQQVIKYAKPIFIFSPKTQISFLGMMPWDRFLKVRKKLRDSITTEIAKREKDLEGREDILSMLMSARYEDGSAMDREHLFDELGTFLFAGHETSAVAMAWAVYSLLTHREAHDRLVAELDAANISEPGELAKLPWLGAIVNETLRLYPVVSDVLRILKHPMELGEFVVPAGHAVAAAISLAHFNEEVYPEPDRFNPQRFIDRSYDSSEYLPFGGGARRCAGAAFALYEMAIVLGTLFSRYKLELKETRPVVPKRRNVTIGTSTGIRVSITRRN